MPSGNTEFGVERLIEENIGGEASDRLRKIAFDLRDRGRRLQRRRGDERLAPGRRGVPQILHTRIVVKTHAVDEAVATEICNIGEANICVVDAEASTLVVIGELDERADVVGNPSGIEKTELLRQIGGGFAGIRIVRLGGEARRRHDHRRKRREVAQRQRALLELVDVLDLERVKQRIAARLEHAPKRGQLRKHSVTGLAGKSCLACIARNG